MLATTALLSAAKVSRPHSQFCRLMGGDIAVESEPGRGSTFTSRLPAVVGSAPRLPVA